MISKTKIKSRILKKTNPEIIETIKLALKNPEWLKIARILSASTRKYSSINLFEIDKQTTPGDIIIIPGKVLSKGEVTKKVRICALSMSMEAKEKLKTTKSEFVPLINEIKSNPKAEGVKILR